MAITPIVDGLCLVKIAAPTTIQSLGYTRNGAEVTAQTFMRDLPSDEQGGDDGPPVDIQYFGDIHVVRLSLTKWDATVADFLFARLAAGTAGTPGTPGTLMFGDSKSYRLILHTTSRPYNYPRVVFREPYEVNKGTKFSELVLVATCYEDATGVLYNATTT